MIEFPDADELILYLKKWEPPAGYYDGDYFQVIMNGSKLDLKETLHTLKGEKLLKLAIDIGVETPDFIPSIPTFKNEIKSDYRNAYGTFVDAQKLIESNPSLAIGLANSALESIIKEILKDERISEKVKNGATLNELTIAITREFNRVSDEHPSEIKTIGNSLMNANKAIEKLRSEKTNFHGKTSEDVLIEDSIYASFIVNSVATVGLYLSSFYRLKFPKPLTSFDDGDLPF